MSAHRFPSLRIGAAIAAAVLVVSCAATPAVRDLQPAPIPGGLTFHAGKRSDQGGVPVLDLSGSRHEVGLQYGVLLRPEIHAVYAKYEQIINDLTGGGLRRDLFIHSFRGRVSQMRAELPAGFEDELRGIAEGAGLPFSDFLFFALTPEFLFDASCTSLVVRSGSEIAHARNFDFVQPASFIARYPVITRVAVDGKIPYLNVGFIGLPGVYTGLNERGIAASVNTAAFSVHANGNVIPVGFLVKALLENSATLAEADSVMLHATVSHYFITVSSRDERDAAIYENLGDAVTKVPMTGTTLGIENAPVSTDNRHARASILSQAEYNISREHALGELTARAPSSPLPEYLLGILGNHDFYHYRDFPVHQTLAQDSLKTINNYETIQSVVIDWTGDRVIFSYRPCYAGFGPFLAYDLASGRITRYRDADLRTLTSTYRDDTGFLDDAFALAQRHAMSLDSAGWRKVLELIDEHPDMNAFLKADWTFTASLALGRLDDAKQAAQQIEEMFPDYYLGPLDLGIAAYRGKNWAEARSSFLVSAARPISSPATRLLACAYASLASGKLDDRQLEAQLDDQAAALLESYWTPPDLEAQISAHAFDGEVAKLIADTARRGEPGR